MKVWVELEDLGKTYTIGLQTLLKALEVELDDETIKKQIRKMISNGRADRQRTE